MSKYWQFYDKRVITSDSSGQFVQNLRCRRPISYTGAVDELLDGNDIEEGDPSAVPELRAVLKQHQTEAIKRLGYDSAKVLSGHLDRIHQLVENQKKTQPVKISRQKEETLIAGIKAREKILRKLQKVMMLRFPSCARSRRKRQRRRSVSTAKRWKR